MVGMIGILLQHLNNGNHLLDDLPILGVPEELEILLFHLIMEILMVFQDIEKYKGEVAAVILEPRIHFK